MEYHGSTMVTMEIPWNTMAIVLHHGNYGDLGQLPWNNMVSMVFPWNTMILHENYMGFPWFSMK